MKRCALAILLGTSGCFLFGNDDGGADPCDADRFGCADGELDVDPSCELQDELVVAVGGGEGEFEPLPEGTSPKIFNGAQGGQHVLVGVRIDNAALDRYDELQVQLGIFSASQCPEDDDLLAACTGTPTGGTRTVVLGDEVELAIVEGGVVEEHDIVVFLEAFTDAMVLEAIVVDPCGQQGIARHRM